MKTPASRPSQRLSARPGPGRGLSLPALLLSLSMLGCPDSGGGGGGADGGFPGSDGGVAQVAPDPATVAPPLDPGAPTLFADAVSFLYSGTAPLQQGVTEGAIDRERVGVLRGRVLAPDGSGLPGVRITLLRHPELGSSTTRADGRYDLAINGGGLEVLTFTASADLVPAQRRIVAPRHDYLTLEDVVLVRRDGKVTQVSLQGSGSHQLVRGSASADTAGARTATLLIPPGTSAGAHGANATSQPLPELHIRLTELTVGAAGSKAMPATLPPNSSFTYAVELSADEALATGATGVTFSQEMPFYVENFLHLPTGRAVPVGFYDAQTGQWSASKSGRILKVLSVAAGMASLDVDGSGQPASAAALAQLGITDAELRQLGGLYAAGSSLWRVALSHFSIMDLNWCAEGGVAPGVPSAVGEADGSCQVTGASVIDVPTQVLSEALPLAGTPFNLTYSSARAAGRKGPRTLTIPLTTTNPPAGLQRVDLSIDVAGRAFRRSFSPAAAQTYSFYWDGLDGYGRKLQGSWPVSVNVKYAFPAQYFDTPQFGASPTGEALGASREESLAEQSWSGYLESWNTAGAGLGGWELDIHHVYDVGGGVVHQGDGTHRTPGSPLSSSRSSGLVGPFAGNGTAGFAGDAGPAVSAKLDAPTFMAAGADGSLYVTDWQNRRVRRVEPSGRISTVAGNGETGIGGDGGPATAAPLMSPGPLAVASDGSLFVADACTVRRVDPQGIISTIAGDSTTCGTTGDDAPATSAQLGDILGLAFGPEGSLYLLENPLGTDLFTGSVLRRIDAQGIITTVAGGGTGQGGQSATSVVFAAVGGLAVGLDGTLYVSELDGLQVIRRDGRVTKLLSPCSPDGNGLIIDGDGGPLGSACARDELGNIVSGADQAIYFVDGVSIRRIGSDGRIDTIAGTIGPEPCRNLGLALGVCLPASARLAARPDGTVFFSDEDQGRVYSISRPEGQSRGLTLLLPSEDAAEIFVFSPAGRHLQTLEALTGAVRFQFNYDDRGAFASVADADGNTTTLERAASGAITALVAPAGQRTALALDANGYLTSITNPAGEATSLVHSADGLLIGLTDANGAAKSYRYDAQGRLLDDRNAAGGGYALARTERANGSFTVGMQSAGGRRSSFEMDSGGASWRNTGPDGLTRTTQARRNQSVRTQSPDGLVFEESLVPGDRFGMAEPVAESSTLTLPSGLVCTGGQTLTSSLSEPSDALSLTRRSQTETLAGKAWRTVFDATARTLTATSPAGRTVVRTLDTKGRLAQLQMGNLAPLTFSRDSRGRLEGVAQSRRTSSLAYDPSGNVASLTDATGSTARFGYDRAGRPTSVTLADGAILSLGYDRQGVLTSLTPPGSGTHRLARSQTGLLTDYTAPALAGQASVTHVDYEADGLPTRVSYPGGETLDLTYETSPNSGRLATLATAAGVTSFAYSPTTGRLQRLDTSDSGGSLALDFDGPLLVGQTVETAFLGAPVGLQRTYDESFRVINETLSGLEDAASVAYAYDDDGLLTGAGQLSLTRDASTGALRTAVLGRLTQTYSQNAYGEVASIAATSGGAPLYAFTLDEPAAPRDDLGRVTQRTEVIGAERHVFRHHYDSAGRLTDVEKDGVSTGHYGYDANGNRVAASGLAQAPTYDAQDRLLTYASCSYAYKASGTLRSKTCSGATTNYDYDVAGNLRAVVLPDGGHIEYAIDGLGRRVGRARCTTPLEVPCPEGSATDGFVFDGLLRPVAWVDGAGALKARFVYALQVNVPDYMITSAGTYRIVTDPVGSPRLVVDAATGAIAQRLDYDAWGQVLQDSNPGFQPFGFAGGLWERDTGLLRLGARDYEPATGRWTGKDPLLFAGGSPNLYAYAGNDPVNFHDPSGLCFWSTFKKTWAYDFETVNDFAFGDSWHLGKKVMGLITAGATGEALGTVTLWRAVTSLLRPGMGPPGVATLGVAGTIGSAALTMLAKAAVGFVSLETGFAIGAAADALGQALADDSVCKDRCR